MPITAKLSRKFYDTFGEDVVNELVEWFNMVDATYHSGLRELNEFNFGRFRAEMVQQIATLRAEMIHEISAADGKWERRFAELKSDMAQLRADLIKWMFVFWATTALGVIGLIKF